MGRMVKVACSQVNGIELQLRNDFHSDGTDTGYNLHGGHPRAIKIAGPSARMAGVGAPSLGAMVITEVDEEFMKAWMEQNALNPFVQAGVISIVAEPDPDPEAEQQPTVLTAETEQEQQPAEEPTGEEAEQQDVGDGGIDELEPPVDDAAIDPSPVATDPGEEVVDATDDQQEVAVDEAGDPAVIDPETEKADDAKSSDDESKDSEDHDGGSSGN